MALKGIDVRACKNSHTEYVIPAVKQLHRTMAMVLSEQPTRVTND